MAKLTALKVANLKPKDHRIEVPDSGSRGLYCVVQPSGAKSWAVRYRHEGKPRKLTLGGLTLAEARVAAAKAMSEVARGIDPAAAKSEAKVEARVAVEKAAAALAADRVETHVAQFLKHQRKNTRPSSFQQTEHIFGNIVLPEWRERSVHEIRRRDIISLVKAVADGDEDEKVAPRPVLANRTLAQVSRFFSWLMEQAIVETSPATGAKRPTKEAARERVLSDTEIRSLWIACETIGSPAAKAVQLMLLSGQRRNECAGARRPEIAGDLWSLPASRVKNNRSHSVPLSKQAVALIEQQPALGDFVFSTDGEKPVTSFGRVKIDIDNLMRPESPWTLHDLRRTVATNMQKLGIALPVVEKILNHVGGSFAGVAGIYQRHDYATERRIALQKWADHVDDIVHGKVDGNVVRLVRP